jgi:predicted Zn-dependent peptidase
MSPCPPEADTHVHTLRNGVRVLAIVQPHLESASVSVFVRTGSRHESARLNGISHVVEHMAFKGTHTRSCQQINLDAERLGAEVNAHTDKDHTAYHMCGLAQHAGVFIRMLGDIVLHSSYPEAELERERQVILQEYLEDEDDALSTAFKLFDQACFGRHALAQPVIGQRRNIERFSRDELLAYVQRQYSGHNLIVAVAGPVDPQAMAAEAEAAFGAMPAGDAHVVAAPAYVGGVRARRQTGSSQTHVVLGFPIPSLVEDAAPAVVAAALFGEGMSSPLLDTVRERLGLVYYAGCSADLSDLAGQFVIEASTTPEHLDAYVETVTNLLREQAERIDPIHLERARNQLAVRSLRARERTQRRLESAAQDLFIFGRVRPAAEWAARVAAVDAGALRAEFARMLSAPAAFAMAGKVPVGAKDRCTERLARLRAAP